MEILGKVPWVTQHCLEERPNSHNGKKGMDSESRYNEKAVLYSWQAFEIIHITEETYKP